MFIAEPNKSLFEVMMDFDQSSEAEDRWKELRNGVGYYNSNNGTRHELTSDLLRNYWVWLRAAGLLTEY